MTRRACPLLLLFSLGCVDLEFKVREAPLRAPATISPAAIAAPITPERVTSENARQMAQGLWDELDRDDLAPPDRPQPDQRK